MAEFYEVNGKLYAKTKDGVYEVSGGQERPEPPPTLARIGKGFSDVKDGIQQLYKMATDPQEAQRFTEEKNRDRAIYDKALKDSGQKGIDGAALVGSGLALAPFAAIPGARETMLGQMTAGGLTGAAASSAMYAPSGTWKEKGLQAGIGFIGGAAIPPLATGVATLTGNAINLGTKGLGNLAGRINLTDKITMSVNNELKGAGIDFSKLSADVQKNIINDAKMQLNISGKLDPEALARKAYLGKMGFSGDAAPTTGQVTRSPRLWARERNLSKLEDGEEVQGRFINQNRRFMDIQDDVAGNIKSTVTDDYEAGESVINATVKRWRDTQKEVGAIYKDIETKHGNMPVSDESLLPFLSKIDEMADDATSGSITNSVINRLKRYGVMDEDLNPVGSLTLKQAESMRKFINKLSDGGDPNLIRVKGEIIDGLDDSVIESVGDDVFSTARDAARQRFSEFGVKSLQNITKGAQNADDLVAKISKLPVKELEALKNSLSKSPEGLQAWEDARLRVLDGIWQKATAGKGRDGVFSGAAYDRAIKALGKRGEVLFKDEWQTLQNTQRAGLDLTYQPPFSAVNYSNTTPALFNLMQRSRMLPAIGDALSSAGKSGAQQIEIARMLSGGPVDAGLIKGAEGETIKAIQRGLLGTRKAGQIVPSSGGLLSNALVDEYATR